MSTDNDHISTILSWLDTTPRFLCNTVRAKSQNLLSWWQVEIFIMKGWDVIINGWNFSILVYLYSMVLFSFSILIFTFISFSSFIQRSFLFIQKFQFCSYIQWLNVYSLMVYLVLNQVKINKVSHHWLRRKLSLRAVLLVIICYFVTIHHILKMLMCQPRTTENLYQNWKQRYDLRWQ